MLKLLALFLVATCAVTFGEETNPGVAWRDTLITKLETVKNRREEIKAAVQKKVTRSRSKQKHLRDEIIKKKVARIVRQEKEALPQAVANGIDQKMMKMILATALAELNATKEQRKEMPRRELHEYLLEMARTKIREQFAERAAGFDGMKGDQSLMDGINADSTGGFTRDEEGPRDGTKVDSTGGSTGYEDSPRDGTYSGGTGGTTGGETNDGTYSGGTGGTSGGETNLDGSRDDDNTGGHTDGHDQYPSNVDGTDNTDVNASQG